MMNATWLKQNKWTLLRIFSWLTIPAAIFHAVHIFYHDATSPVRHGVFVFINLFIFFLFHVKWSYLKWVMLALTLQQLYSHGGAFIRAWQQHRFDGISLGVMIILPLVTVLLFLNDTATHKKIPGN
jgi:hypothetical protein